MPKLSIVVPVYNEEPLLEKAVARLLGANCPIEREWIFVNDGSTDGSLELLRKLIENNRGKHNVRLLEHAVNRGKGAACITGFGAASGDFVMIHDADFEYDPNDIPSLLPPLIEGSADAVYGSRFLRGRVSGQHLFHYFVNWFLTKTSNLFTGLRLTDMETCYKIFRAEFLKAQPLASQRFGIEVELTALVAKKRARLLERPITYFPRAKVQGKKITWKDGFAALWHIVRFNLLA